MRSLGQQNVEFPTAEPRNSEINIWSFFCHVCCRLGLSVVMFCQFFVQCFCHVLSFLRAANAGFLGTENTGNMKKTKKSTNLDIFGPCRVPKIKTITKTNT